MFRRMLEVIKLIIRKIHLILKPFFISLGVLLFFALGLSFTDYPFWAYYWLGTHNSELVTDPEVIVVMGGGGMPSADGLMRCYYGSLIGHQYPEAKIIIAIPGDTSMHEESPELMMARELIIRGIDSTRILFEENGYNTFTQAINIKNILGIHTIDTVSVRIVTTPEHMLRSVACFRKAGFTCVGGMPSFEEAIEEEFLTRKVRTRGSEKADIRALELRYNMWNYLKYEITVLREYVALGYYKIRGWI
jgi:uncharacterized SAM-binding protein YcdF (DUF218 family)